MRPKLIASLTAFALANVLSTNLLLAQVSGSPAAQPEADTCNAYPEFQCGPTPQELEQEQQRNQARKLKKQMKKEAKRQREAEVARQHNLRKDAGN